MIRKPAEKIKWLAVLLTGCLQPLLCLYAQSDCQCVIPPKYTTDKLLLTRLNEICRELPYRNDIRLIPCSLTVAFCSEYKINPSTSYIEEKIIYYNSAYIDSFGSGINREVTATAILSHELYHLFKADPQRRNISVNEKRLFELDADKFAGAIMRKMNISEVVLDKFLARWKEVSARMAQNMEDYPPMQARADSLRAGYYDMVNFELTRFQIAPSISKKAIEQLTVIAQLRGADTAETLTKCIAKLVDIIPRYPDCYLAYNKLGEYQYSLYKLYKQGRYRIKDTLGLLNKAVENFRAALSYKFSYTEASYNFSNTLTLLGLETQKVRYFERAYQEASKAIIYTDKKDSISSGFFLLMATALSYLGKNEEADIIISGLEAKAGIINPCEAVMPACLTERIKSLTARYRGIKGF